MGFNSGFKGLNTTSYNYQGIYAADSKPPDFLVFGSAVTFSWGGRSLKKH